MTNGEGVGDLGLSNREQAEAMAGTQTFPKAGGDLADFPESSVLMWGAATPSRGPSVTLITKKKPISPDFQTPNDSIIRLVMCREIVRVCLGAGPEPERVRAPLARVCHQDASWSRRPVSG